MVISPTILPFILLQIQQAALYPASRAPLLGYGTAAIP